jgi:hypothetical protein
MAFTIQSMTTKERLHKLVDELSEAEADDALVILDRSRDRNAKGVATGRAIAAGYERIPQTAEEDAWAEANAREAVRDERW